MINRVNEPLIKFIILITLYVLSLSPDSNPTCIGNFKLNKVKDY